MTTARVPMIAPAADFDTGHYHGFIAYPNIIAEFNIAFVVPCFAYSALIKVPFVKENREGISRKRTQRVISACKKEFRTAGDRAEPAYLQPVPVDRITVKDVVLFKIARDRSQNRYKS